MVKFSIYLNRRVFVMRLCIIKHAIMRHLYVMNSFHSQERRGHGKRAGSSIESSSYIVSLVPDMCSRIFYCIMHKKILKGMTLESNKHTYKIENGSSITFFWARQVSFGQLCLISGPNINFQKCRNGLNYHKGPENINYTIYSEVYI